MFFTGNVLQNPSAFSIIKSCVVVPVKALKESGAPGQMQAAKGSGCRPRRFLAMASPETLPLDTDHDYLYDVGNYVVHLQVKDGAIAFLDSQCPDHVCEQFGWLDKDGAWAALRPCRGVCGSGNYS